MVLQLLLLLLLQLLQFALLLLLLLAFLWGHLLLPCLQVVLIGDTLAVSRRAHRDSQRLAALLDCKGVPYLFIDTNAAAAQGIAQRAAPHSSSS